MITVDNGPEFAGKVMDEWAYRRGIKLTTSYVLAVAGRRTPLPRASTAG